MFAKFIIFLVTVFTLLVGNQGLNVTGKNCYSRFECSKNFHNNLYMKASTALLKLERRLENGCHLRSNARLREVIGANRYKLTTKLKGYSDDDFDIKIRGPILYLIVRKGNTFNAEVMALPRFVEVAKASYMYDGETLDIIFPIKTMTRVCDHGFRSDEMFVPKFEVVWGNKFHQIQVMPNKFGD